MMKILLLIFVFFLAISSISAQTSDEISLFTTCPKLTKDELKRIKKWNDDLQKGKAHILPSEPIKVFVGIESKTLENGKIFGKLNFQTSSYELVYKEITPEISKSNLNIFVRFSSIDNKFNKCFEEVIEFSLNKNEFGKNRTLSFSKMFDLPKGKYKLHFLIRCIETGLIGEQKFYFEI